MNKVLLPRASFWTIGRAHVEPLPREAQKVFRESPRSPVST